MTDFRRIKYIVRGSESGISKLNALLESHYYDDEINGFGRALNDVGFDWEGIGTIDLISLKLLSKTKLELILDFCWTPKHYVVDRVCKYFDLECFSYDIW